MRVNPCLKAAKYSGLELVFADLLVTSFRNKLKSIMGG